MTMQDQPAKHIYDDGEFANEATHKEFLSVRREGSRDVQRQIDFYNLDAIIFAGYRVKSRVALLREGGSHS